KHNACRGVAGARCSIGPVAVEQQADAFGRSARNGGDRAERQRHTPRQGAPGARETARDELPPVAIDGTGSEAAAARGDAARILRELGEAFAGIDVDEEVER